MMDNSGSSLPISEEMRCPICDEIVPKGTTICPHCKEDISKVLKSDAIDESYKCPICDESIEVGTTVCPHCGEQISNIATTDSMQNINSPAVVVQSQQNKSFFWPIFSVICLLIIGFLLFRYSPWKSIKEDIESIVHDIAPEDNDAKDTPSVIIDEDVLASVRADELYIPRTTEVGLLFRERCIFDEYVKENDIKFPEYATPDDYLSIFSEAISQNANLIATRDFSKEYINRIRREANDRYEANYHSIPDDDQNGFFKDAFNNCKGHFDRCFKSLIAYDFICRHWEYRDVNKLEDLYSFFTDADFYNYYQDYVFYSEVGEENSMTDFDEILFNWNQGHQSNDADIFYGLFADEVKYYQSTYTPEQIIASKKKLFEKYPHFYQTVEDVVDTRINEQTKRIDFNKNVWTTYPDGECKTYPSYLIVKKFSDGWKIIAESDKITDENLAKRK